MICLNNITGRDYKCLVLDSNYIFKFNIVYYVDSGDCGMFVIKTAEFLMHGLPLTDLKQDNMGMYRQKLVIDLYKHGRLKQDNRCMSDNDM